MKKVVCFLFVIIVGISGFLIHTADARSPEINTGSAPANALLQRNSITGFVFDQSGRPVADVYVELLTDTYSTVSRIKTSGSGFYAFRNLQNRTYVVKVLAYGTNFEEQSRAVSLVSISAIPGSGSISEQVDFYLTFKRDSNSGPLAAPGVIFAQDVPDDAKKLYEEGIKQLRDKKDDEGFANLRKSLEVFPKYFLALDRLGTEYVVRGYYRPAYVLLSKALEVNPRSFSSTFGLGLAQYRLKEIDKSVKTLQLATSLYPDSISAHLWLGIAYHENGQTKEAEESLKQANKLSRGKSPDVHWQLARIYGDQKRYAEAADQLELFLKHSSDSEQAIETEKIEQTIIQLRQKAKESN